MSRVESAQVMSASGTGAHMNTQKVRPSAAAGIGGARWSPVLPGVTIGAFLLWIGFWLPASIFAGSRHQWEWFGLIARQLAIQLTEAGWSIVGLGVALLSGAVAIIAFVGAREATGASELKRGKFMELADYLLLGAVTTGTIAFASISLVILNSDRADPGSKVRTIPSGAALQRIEDAYGQSTMAIVMSLIALGLIVGCRTADKAIKAWSRSDREDLAREQNKLSLLMAERQTQQRIVRARIKRYADPPRSDKITVLLAIARMAGVVLVSALSFAVADWGLARLEGFSVDFLGASVGGVFTAIHFAAFVPTYVAYRKVVWLRCSGANGRNRDASEAREWRHGLRMRAIGVCASSMTMPALLLWIAFAQDPRGVPAFVMLALMVTLLFVAPTVLLVMWKGRYSCEDLALRSAARYLAILTREDERRFAELGQDREA